MYIITVGNVKSRGAGVPASPVYEIDDMVKDPQYVARQSIQSMAHPLFDKISVPAIHPVFSGTPCQIRSLGKPLGADNEEIYCGRMGLSADELKSLKEFYKPEIS